MPWDADTWTDEPLDAPDEGHFALTAPCANPTEVAAQPWPHQDGHAPWDAVVLAPGECAHTAFLSQPDPLVGMDRYGFPAFCFEHTDGCLVDTNGDGVMDQTAWGTPVTVVEPYMRADGTWVRGHYRTHPDGLHANNLGAHHA